MIVFAGRLSFLKKPLLPGGALNNDWGAEAEAEEEKFLRSWRRCVGFSCGEMLRDASGREKTVKDR